MKINISITITRQVEKVIQALLDDVAPGAMKFHQIWRFAEKAEEKLTDARLPLPDRAGAIARMKPWGSLNEMDEPREDVEVTMLRGITGWKITGLEKVLTYPRADEVIEVAVTRHQEEVILRRAMGDLRSQ
jgi:hypothetical protein